MAKVPQPGRCKTRLVPPLTPDQAAALSAAFLRDITENLAGAARGANIAPYIAYAPAGLSHLFEGMVAHGTDFVLADGTANMPDGVSGFGRCLLHAIGTLLEAGFASVCVLNSDSPTLPTRILQRATELLAQPGDRMVLGPADDGGYYLLGVKAVHAALFTEIAWSTDRVAEQTLARARAIGLPIDMLPAWYDVDDAMSLTRLRRDLAAGALAPASARVLHQIARDHAARQLSVAE